MSWPSSRLLSSGVPLPTCLEIVESQDSLVPLSEDAAVLLQRLGRELASSSDWWGRAAADGPRDSSVIDVVAAGHGLWRVRVREAVGIIALRELQLHVRPKIPDLHFLHLAQRSTTLPRLSRERGTTSEGPLWELVIAWFLEAAEQLLRAGLLRDYAETRDTLRVVRGRIDATNAARRYYSGTLLFDCQFEDHVEDTPPNRILRAATAHAARAPRVHESLRQRARRLLTRFEAVGALREYDLRWHPSRREAFYVPPLMLARHVLRSTGRSLMGRGELMWTFLIRTPELIEEGVRSVLQEALGTSVVMKKRQPLAGSELTLNPDLRFFGDRAVGDVKYKLRGDWNRADLYQVLAFAAGLRCFDAAIVNFASNPVTVVTSLDVGDHRVKQFSWPCGDPDPANAARGFAGVIGTWLESVTRRQAGVSRAGSE